ncbi:unnamed protein product, partial [marine sediment metagenome]
KIPLDYPYDIGLAGGYEVLAEALTYNAGMHLEPGDCIVVDSLPGVYKELDFHQWVNLTFAVKTMAIIGPWPEDPIGTTWTDGSMDVWWLWIWVDEDENGTLSQYDQIWMEKELGPYEAGWFRVNEINHPTEPSMVVQEKTIVEHQYDLACIGEPSLHKFKIQNAIYPPPGVTDPVPENNLGATEMLVACTDFADGEIAWVDTPPLPDPWNVDVSTAETRSVAVNAYNFHPTPGDFLVTLEASSPGLGIIPGGQMVDTDGDGWADNV